MEALSGPRPKSSRLSQGQPAGKPAGPSSARKRPGVDEDPIILPEEKKAAEAKGAGGAAGAANERKLIEIDAGVGVVPRPSATIDPFNFYNSYYHSREKDRIDPNKLRQTLSGLNRLRKYREVHAAILGYLKNQAYHRVELEPWMYEALALAIKMDNGSEADVKKSLEYAADLAEKTNNPNQLVSVADLLYRRGHFDRVGKLLDQAMKKIPHRAEPIEMSINLARQTINPIRMADSVERLLSLGWPGQDDVLRLQATNQVDEMVKQLLARNRKTEADAHPAEPG